MYFQDQKIIQSISYGYSDIWHIFFVLLCCLLKWQMSICRLAQLTNKAIQKTISHLLRCTSANNEKNVYEQGANATYQSVRKAELTTQIQDEIKENIQKECKKNRSWKRDLRHINQLIFHLWLDNFNVQLTMYMDGSIIIKWIQ